MGTYRYLKSTSDIEQRIVQAKTSFNKKKTVFCSNNIDIEVRKRLVKSLVWSVALYGSETWTVSKADRKKLEAFEMWCWRRMKKVKWTDRVSNERVLGMVNERRQLWNTLTERRHKCIGHIYRHNNFVVNIIEGQREGQQGRGRPRMSYIKQIMEHAKVSRYSELKRVMNDRDVWRTRTANQSSD
uniref:Endonuclease-reverse transcriptase n=2 Tax=Cacopsylla melanoneura TaxID=428564 RepID=A0A8D9ENE8_9HEMI